MRHRMTLMRLIPMMRFERTADELLGE